MTRTLLGKHRDLLGGKGEGKFAVEKKWRELNSKECRSRRISYDVEAVSRDSEKETSEWGKDGYLGELHI